MDKNKKSGRLKDRFLKIVYGKRTERISFVISLALLAIVIVCFFFTSSESPIRYTAVFITFLYVFLVDRTISSIKRFDISIAYKNDLLVLLFSDRSFWDSIFWIASYAICMCLENLLPLWAGIILIVVLFVISTYTLSPKISNFYKRNIKD